MVALRLPAANNSKSVRRTLRAATPYFTRILGRRKELVLSEKPGLLRHVGVLDQKVWEQYETILKRATSPLDEAEYYARQMESRGFRSIAALAQFLKRSAKRVCRCLKLLDLAEPIRKFLAEHKTPEILRYFTECRLRGLVRLDARSAWRRFQAMVTEARNEAGIWRAEAKD